MVEGVSINQAPAVLWTPATRLHTGAKSVEYSDQTSNVGIHLDLDNNRQTPTDITAMRNRHFDDGSKTSIEKCIVTFFTCTPCAPHGMHSSWVNTASASLTAPAHSMVANSILYVQSSDMRSTPA